MQLIFWNHLTPQARLRLLETCGGGRCHFHKEAHKVPAATQKAVTGWFNEHGDGTQQVTFCRPRTRKTEQELRAERIIGKRL